MCVCIYIFNIDNSIMYAQLLCYMRVLLFFQQFLLQSFIFQQKTFKPHGSVQCVPYKNFFLYLM